MTHREKAGKLPNGFGRETPGSEQKTRSMRYSDATQKLAFDALTRQEREGLLAIYQAASRRRLREVRSAITDYVVSRYRQSGKAAQDAARDARRRKLVGARVDRDLASRVEADALATHRSVYRYVVDALEAQLSRQPDENRETREPTRE